MTGFRGLDRAVAASLLAACPLSGEGTGSSTPPSAAFHAHPPAVVLVDMSFPRLAWNTNVASLTLQNPDSRPHEIEIDVPARHTTLQVGAIQSQAKLVLAPDDGRVIDWDFIIKPLPGSVRVRFAAADPTDGVGILRDFYTQCPVKNTRINRLKLPPQLPREPEREGGVRRVEDTREMAPPPSDTTTWRTARSVSPSHEATLEEFHPRWNQAAAELFVEGTR